jgi:hypothetical protein
MRESASGSGILTARRSRMPYKIIRSDGKFGVQNTATGSVRWHNTLKKAEAQMRLLYGVEHGWKPTKKGGSK